MPALSILGSNRLFDDGAANYNSAAAANRKQQLLQQRRIAIRNINKQRGLQFDAPVIPSKVAPLALSGLGRQRPRNRRTKLQSI